MPRSVLCGNVPVVRFGKQTLFIYCWFMYADADADADGDWRGARIFALVREAEKASRVIEVLIMNRSFG